MGQAIQKSGVVLQSEFSQDVRSLMSGNKEKRTPFMKLFWQQQQESIYQESKCNQISSNDHTVLPVIGCQICLSELCQTTKSLTGIQRFVVLAFDEMKVQSKLVFNKNTGDLVGFLDLGDPDINFTAFDDAEELASHALEELASHALLHLGNCQ
ncbi:Hypothetical predicted protein [Paramuricea clavata]|uniref:Transposable element P transposase-like RNase H domain-containing protein n=1 Tax=Paramuricea clavata TaxID=317549 RepID=A0A7D9HCQ9_PARCT|nr:Hypothetical predicted protein [Paramuricea clavata]